MRITAPILASILATLAGTANAHEVSASSTTVIVEDGKVEILQTTPIATAAEVVTSRTSAPIGTDQPEEILNAMATHWAVSGADTGCELTRQAYRVQHHGMELQMRYLFACEAGDAPQRLDATWLDATPSDHFLIFTIKAHGKEKTVIFEHQDLSIDISQLS
ncbi:MAG: hypothetical protein AAGI14_06965 [Pseudomonadota bacterium]